MKNHIISTVWCIIVLIMVESCGVKSDVAPSSGTLSADESPKMVFVEGIVRYDSISNEYSMQLLSMQKKEGSVKQFSNEYDLNPTEGFNYVLRGVKKENIAIYGMENPLRKRWEYADEDGKLYSKEITQKEADFFVRIPLTREVTKIEFRYKTQVLLTVQL